jgi:hypothetical protein
MNRQSIYACPSKNLKARLIFGIYEHYFLLIAYTLIIISPSFILENSKGRCHINILHDRVSFSYLVLR